MLSNILLADFIEKKLNTTGGEYSFRIYTEIAELKSGTSKMISGRLRATSAGEVVPMPEFANSQVPFEIDFVVNSHGFDNTHIVRVSEIIKRFIRDVNGKEFDLDNGKAIIIPGEPTFYNLETRPASGDSALCSWTFEVNYYENAVSSANRKWFLDGVELPYFSERVNDNRSGVTNNISGKTNAQSLTLQQVKSYLFELPYHSTNAACIQLQQDILDGDPDKTYELKFYDGVTYTSEEPFIKTVTLFNDSNSETIRSRVNSFVVAFAETDKAEETGVRYYMALIDNPFSPDTPNTRFFESQELQQQYYEDKVLSGAAFVPILAPNLQGLTVTQQIYKDVNNYELLWLLQKNYAIIKVVDHDNPEEKPQYLYFWAKGNVGAKNMTLWDLRLDSIQTYLFDDRLLINDCLIERAHLNRWIRDSERNLIFDNGPNSPMLNQDGVELPKVLKERIRVYPSIDTTILNHPQTHNSLNKYIQNRNWIKIWLSPTADWKPGAEGISGKTYIPQTIFKQSNVADSGLILLVVPTVGNFSIETSLKDNTSVRTTVSWNREFVFDFIRKEKLEPYIVSIQVTPVCPLSVSNHTVQGTYSYSTIPDTTIVNGITITNTTAFNLSRGSLFYYNEEGAIDEVDENAETIPENAQAIWCLTNQSQNSAFAEVEIPYTTKFKPADIVGQNTDPKFNPKLLSQYYRSLRISDYAGNSFDYDIQKLNQNKIRLLFDEINAPDLVKGYVRVMDNANSVYNNGMDSNYTGLVYSNDCMLPLYISSEAQFNAVNKNFAAIQQTTRDYNEMHNRLDKSQMWINYSMGAMRGIQSGAASGAKSGGVLGAIIGAAEGVNSAAWGATQTGVQHAFMNARLELKNSLSRKMEAFTLDNVKAAPGDLKNAQGSIQFASIVDKDIDSQYICFYVDIMTASDNDLMKMNETFNLYGYSYARTGLLKNFINIRKYYNYIQADIDAIGGISLSNDVRADIKSRFAGGLRFWNSDVVNYNKENYENSI